MPKLPPPKLPKKRNKRSGLEQLWNEEPTTERMKVIAEVPSLVPCPACNGSTFSRVEELNGPSLGRYLVVQCDKCTGRGRVTMMEAHYITESLKTK